MDFVTFCDHCICASSAPLLQFCSTPAVLKRSPPPFSLDTIAIAHPNLAKNARVGHSLVPIVRCGISPHSNGHDHK